MKILAIRGKNLASLCRSFELDLTRSPLRDAGLFAITGPTGAGKTTILDAMCLALFDEVPRYSSSHRFQNQDTRDPGLSSTDPRNLLRHGAIEGLAEVDFRGIDRRAYRATWTVRRAYNRADGQLQNQNMSMRCLDDDLRFGDTRTEVKRAIVEKLGLDYVQFCRSVLLAQGEFANFIRSDPKKRAELLERITGTQLYSRLSIAAHQRHREEQQRLFELGSERGALNLMDEEQLTALQHQTELLLAAEREGHERLQGYEQAEAQLRRGRELQKALTEAARQVEETQAALTLLTGQNIEAILAAQPLRPYAEARDRVQARLAEMAAEAPRLDAVLAEREQHHEQSVAASSQAQAQIEALETQFQALEPDLAAAEALDLRISDRRKQLREDDLAVASQAKKLSQAQQCLADLERATAALAGTRQALQAWLAEHEGDAALAAQWQLWQALLSEAASLQADLDQKPAVSRAQRELAELTDQLKSQTLALEEAEQYRDDRHAAAAALERRAQEHSRDALDQELERLTRDKTACAAIEADFTRLAEFEAQKSQETVALTVLEERLGQVQRDLPELVAANRDLELALAESRRALRLAEESLDLAQRRADLLLPGHPCPLCGAAEHAWHPFVAVHDFLESQRQRTDDLEKALSDGRERQHAIKAEQAATVDRIEERRRAHLDLANRQALQQEQLETHWRQLFSVEQHPDRQRLSHFRHEQESHERRLRADQETARVAHKQAEEARRQARDAAQERDKCLTARDALRAELDALSRRSAEYQARYERAAERDRRIREQLAPLLSQRPEQISDQPQALLDHFGARVNLWRAKDHQQLALQQELAVKTPHIASAQAAVVAARERHQELADQRDRLAAELRDWVRERSFLLDGRDCQTVRHEITSARDTARKNLDQAREQVHVSTREGQLLRQRLDDLTKQQEALESAAADSQTRLAEECARRDVAEVDLTALLAHDPAWCEAKRRELTQARDQLALWQGLHRERCEVWERHRAQTPPVEHEEDLPALLDQARADLEQTREARHTIKARLAEDALRRQRYQELGPAYFEQERATELWQVMSELIGSHDGAKFRKFAQGLTLDLLVQSANSHLRDLHPRYALKRVPGEDLELLVIDLDMAEEERGLAGLSGGETFLVSLALALGLAALNAAGHQIESLFIDEGFGALDAQSLDTALDALDQLQSSGRQVGIISHVNAVAERVACLVKVVPEGNGASIVRM